MGNMRMTNRIYDFKSPRKKKGEFLLEVLEVLGSRCSPALCEINVAVSLI